MIRIAIITVTLVAAALAPAGAAARNACPAAHCPGPHAHHRFIRPQMTGRFHSSVQPLGPTPRGPKLGLPGFTERPVLPGRVAPEPFLQNNLPPVFAPQPAY